jgi:phosphatidate cytidylyltransferase
MLKYRILTGGSFLVLVGLLYVYAPLWTLAAFVTLLTAIAVLETEHLMTHAGYPVLKWTTLAISVLWMLVAWLATTGDPNWVTLRRFMPALAVWGVFLGCLFRSDQAATLSKLTGSFLTLAYMPVLMQFILELLAMGKDADGGKSLVLYGILVIKSTDMGAFFIGSAIGRHKLIPIISPAKSVEGVIGGVAVGMGVSSLLLYLYGYSIGGYGLGVVDGLLLGFLLAVFGVVGDLVESMLKRAAEIKDSGSWLKGLGGILDVLDSLVFALPVLYLYLQLWAGE